MQSALGVLMWTPSEFWKATMEEYLLAVKGYIKANGLETKKGMTRNEFLDLKEKVRSLDKANGKTNR